MKWSWLAVIAAVALTGLVADSGGIPAAMTRLEGIVAEMSAVLLILGVAAAASAWRMRGRRDRACRWPSASGIITRSEVQSKKMRTFFTESRSGSHTKRMYYRAVVRYRYDVGGQRFESDLVHVGGLLGIGGWTQDRASTERLAKPYASSQPVVVHYNPARPAESILDLNLPPVWRQTVIFSIVTLALSAYGFCRMLW